VRAGTERILGLVYGQTRFTADEAAVLCERGVSRRPQWYGQE
jgi:hypothetical protein